MESPVVVWHALLALGPLRPSVATALVRMRDEARAAGLANREIIGPHARRQQFVRYLIASKRLSDE